MPFSKEEIVNRYPFFLHYRGDYRKNLSINIIDIVESNLILHFKKAIVKRLLYLAIEAIQNVERYGAATADDYCFIFTDESLVHIITRNKIQNKDIEKLKSRLDEVNSKSVEELNAVYMEVFLSGEGTTKGAGLGLIDMARKSKNPLDYKFEDVGNDLSNYTLHLRMPISDVPVNEESQKYTVDLMLNVASHFEKNRNTLLYCGDFSNSFLQALLTMLGDMKHREELPVSSVFKYAVIELNQNIKRHAIKRGEIVPASLCIEWKKDVMNLSTFNYLTPQSVEAISEKLDRLNHLSLEVLEEDSEDNMTDFYNHGGMGLIDIARTIWPSKINYKTNSHPEYGESLDLNIDFSYTPVNV